MFFSSKLIALTARQKLDIDRLKSYIESDNKRLDWYDFLAQIYLELNQSSVAELLVEEVKLRAYKNYFFYDERNSDQEAGSPFSLKTPLDQRLQFNKKTH